MPWPIFNRPSIQLGILKAYLENKTTWLTVTTFHPYLEVAHKLGVGVYHFISQRLWIAEAVYATILFGEQDKEKDLLERLVKEIPRSERFDFKTVVEALESHLKQWVDGQQWEQFDLVGFSVCFNQLLSSLTAAHILKERYRHLPLVFGGSSCAGNLGWTLVRTFPEIDFVVDGEGEEALLALCELIAGKRIDLPTGVLTSMKAQEMAGVPEHKSQLTDLSLLPIPDYQDYFRDMKHLFDQEPFIPVLPLEFSRGCWWRRCTFCNLHLQWQGYRSKTAKRMKEELETLTMRHEVLDFVFTDNALPTKEADRFFADLGNDPREFHFFAEIRASQGQKGLLSWKRGGLRQAQVGIESLSKGLLDAMGKGASVIDNIVVMKEAIASGIVLDGNLILEFPGSTRTHVEDTLRNLEFVFPYHPLRAATFFLGHGSPIETCPSHYKIKSIYEHRNSRALFPPAVFSTLSLMIKDYRGDRKQQQDIWRPVRKKVEQWQRFHKARKATAIEKPLLSYRDGGSFLLIRQELDNGKSLHHRLRGTSRKIYLFCDRVRTVVQIKDNFQEINERPLLSFLDDLASKRLLFMEDGKCLSLAVRWEKKDTETREEI